MKATTTDAHVIAHPDPPADCAICPRLADYVGQWRRREPDWHNAPVPTWVACHAHERAVRVLIVGLAPGLRGANRTGRPFVGDQSGAVLFAALRRYGMATDAPPTHPGNGPRLLGCAITNAVRCVPPQNRPTASEINACRSHLSATLARFDRLAVVLTLGRIAHESTVRALGGTVSQHRFGHGAVSRLGGLDLVSSYHCSRYNINTGRLTEAMFDEVMGVVADAAGMCAERERAPSASAARLVRSTAMRA